MDTPNFLTKQFLASTNLSSEFQALSASIAQTLGNLVGGGFVNASLITITNTGLATTVAFNASVLALFQIAGVWKISGAFGTTAGASSQTYNVNLTSLIPGSGSQTIYLYATYQQIGQSPLIAVGPPQQHPDWNPGSVPTSGYAILRDSFAVAAGTSVPAGSIQIASTTITSGGAITGWSTVQQGVAPLTLTLESQLASGVVTGTGSPYALTLPINPTSYASITGIPFTAVIPQTNVGAASMNVNGLGALNIISLNGTGLIGGELIAGVPYIFVYQSGSIFVVNPSFNGGLLQSIGYQKFPNGLILQWGTSQSVTGNSDVINFPIAFPNNVFNVNVSSASLTSVSYSPIILSAAIRNNSSFYLTAASLTNGQGAYGPSYAGGFGFYFTAIGR